MIKFLCIIIISCIIFFIFKSMQKRKVIKYNPKNCSRLPNAEIPSWLINEIDIFKRSALAYELYHISLYQELSHQAKEAQRKLNLKIYCTPPFLLSEVAQEANCTILSMNQYLADYYFSVTGIFKEPTINIATEVQYILQEQAKRKAEKLQQEC